jgi:phosphoribosylformylglycinamidine (FGAM) synthase PurS component
MRQVGTREASDSNALMVCIELAIDLTVPDNTAFTVLTALRGLGYRDLERVERSDILRLRLRDGAMSTEDCARAITHAEVVFNPNKHRLSLAKIGEADLNEAVVTEKDDDNSRLMNLLSARFGVRGLEEMERATAWRLYESGACASEERLAWACRVLLANPYSQSYVVRRRPAYAAV